MRALVLCFFHEKPAQGFRSLVDGKEMMPMHLGDHLEKFDLLGHRLKKTSREAEIDDQARGTFPLSTDRQARWRHKDISPVNVVMVQTKLGDRNPRFPLFCSWPIPKGVGVLRGSDGGSVRGKPVNSDRQRINARSVASLNNQVIDV
jgi:hypothetical protein